MAISEQQALLFIKEYRDLCDKHKIRIGINWSDERYTLYETDYKDQWYFADCLNEALSDFSEKKVKVIKKKKK